MKGDARHKLLHATQVAPLVEKPALSDNGILCALYTVFPLQAIVHKCLHIIIWNLCTPALQD